MNPERPTEAAEPADPLLKPSSETVHVVREENESLTQIRLALAELTLAIKRQELLASEPRPKEKEKDRRVLGSPLTIAIITGVIGLSSAAVANVLQSKATLRLEQEKFRFNSEQEDTKNTATRELEQHKFESSLVLKAIETGDTTVAARNIQFLIDAGYLKGAKDEIEKYIKSGKTPVLPRPNTSVLPQSTSSDKPTTSVVSRKDPFGNTVRYQSTSEDRGITFLDNWEKENIVLVNIPQLVGVPNFPSSGAVRFNKNAAEALKAAWAEIAQKGLIDRVVSWDGSYVAAKVRGSNMLLSPHAWGIAFDINASANPRGARPSPAGTRGSVLDLVPIFEKHGFGWGGNFSRPDSMHFYYKVPSGTQ